MDSPPVVDRMSDDQVSIINGTHKWDAYTLDARGRRIGNPDGRHYPIPHHLVTAAEQWLKVKGRTVVEFGCLEGAHTIALCRLAKSVLAVDVRPDNLVKTAVRCALYGCWPSLALLDVETAMAPGAEVYFHSGVLYHLQDPVHHLRQIGRRCHSLLLDTHYADKPDIDPQYKSADGHIYGAQRRPEEVEEIRAGVRPYSNWLTLDTIKAVLGDHFSDVSVLSEREERNGLRCTIIAKGGIRAR